MKNWEPLVLGPALAMDSSPGRSCFRVKFSSERTNTRNTHQREAHADQHTRGNGIAMQCRGVVRSGVRWSVAAAVAGVRAVLLCTFEFGAVNGLSAGAVLVGEVAALHTQYATRRGNQRGEQEAAMRVVSERHFTKRSAESFAIRLSRSANARGRPRRGQKR